MYCSNCGEKLNEGADVCLKCGRKVSREKASDASNVPAAIPEQYRPISMWGYFGYEILFMVPIVGWIILIIFALGGHQNVNVKNFARSYFCLLIIGIVLALIIASLAGIYAASAPSIRF